MKINRPTNETIRPKQPQPQHSELRSWWVHVDDYNNSITWQDSPCESCIQVIEAQPPATDDAFKPEDCGRLWYYDKFGQKLWYSDARPLPATDDRVKEQGELQWVVKKVRLERYTDYELWCGNQWVSSGLQQAPASKIADFLNGRHK